MGLEYYPEVVSLFSKMNWFIKHDQMCLRKVNLELFGGKWAVESVRSVSNSNNIIMITRNLNPCNHFPTIVFGKGLAVGLIRKVKQPQVSKR